MFHFLTFFDSNFSIKMKIFCISSVPMVNADIIRILFGKFYYLFK